MDPRTLCYQAKLKPPYPLSPSCSCRAPCPRPLARTATHCVDQQHTTDAPCLFPAPHLPACLPADPVVTHSHPPSGLPDIDVDDLRAHTELSGYAPTSPVIRWFWEAVAEMDKQECAQLVQFVTGTSKVPLEGFKALQVPLGARVWAARLALEGREEGGACSRGAREGHGMFAVCAHVPQQQRQPQARLAANGSGWHARELCVPSGARLRSLSARLSSGPPCHLVLPLTACAAALGPCPAHPPHTPATLQGISGPQKFQIHKAYGAGAGEAAQARNHRQNAPSL